MIGAPLEMIRARPVSTEVEPSVAMKDGTFQKATMQPFTSPITTPSRRPAPNPSRTLSGPPELAAVTEATTTLVSATVAPTDRSSCALIRTIICPMAMRRRKTDWRATLSRLEPSTNRGSTMAKTTHIRISRAGRRPVVRTNCTLRRAVTGVAGRSGLSIVVKGFSP